MSIISNDFELALLVEKKNIIRDRNIKKLYNNFKLVLLKLIFIPYNNE
tara:strand:+ start:99 stop:242 length:144 start_codon:yes stop_codon:yes gene_type:complete